MESAVEAFNDTRRQLASTTLFTYPITNAPTVLSTDASAEAVGAVLLQKVKDELLPIAFFSKRLRPTQRSYNAFNREILTVYETMRPFPYFLEVRELHVFTDHKPLTHAMVQSGENFTSRVSDSWLTSLSSSLTSTITGQDNAVANALSRCATPSLMMSAVTPPEPLDYECREHSYDNT